MYYLQVQIVILLYGLTHVYGFFHFRRENSVEESVSFNKTILQSHPIFWIEQRVDHFNYSDQRTWKQKYYKIMNSWKPGGPILLYLNGEAPLALSRLEMTYYRGNSHSLISQIVEETGAAYFMLEHRYYGESQPFDKQTTENLAFLSSRQALADAANLLQTMKESPELKKSKVIVVGGSYAGNLAAWMKLLYPLLVDATLSSSAPVLAKKDFKEYFEGVTDTFRTYGSQECVDEIYNKLNNFHLLLQSPEGIKKLKEENSICEYTDMTVLENQQLFFLNKMFYYAILAQYGTPNNISSTCQNLNLNEQEETLPYNIWNDQLNCYNYDFNEWVKRYNVIQRPWVYQTCTEFGYFQSTSSSKQMFGNSLPVDFYYKLCRVMLGEEFNEERVDQGVMNTNRMYKGLTPNVTSVVFVNGDMDPWHRLGILHDLSADAPAIYMKGSSHCHDFKPDPSDTEDIKEARKRIINLLKKWIRDESEYNNDIF